MQKAKLIAKLNRIIDAIEKRSFVDENTGDVCYRFNGTRAGLCAAFSIADIYPPESPLSQLPPFPVLLASHGGR